MSESENKIVAQRFNEDVWGRGDEAALDELLAPDFVGLSFTQWYCRDRRCDETEVGASTAVRRTGCTSITICPTQRAEPR
jgi:hypothetical protein